MSLERDTLILAWGNPGRADDGLGPALAMALEGLNLPGVRVESDYQLQIENAEEVARHRRVIFVDADRSGPEPFWLGRLSADERSLSFSTHSVSPTAVLALARDLFQAQPEAWILGIRGYDFDQLRERLSDDARSNLDQAVSFLSFAICGEGPGETLSRKAIQSTNNQCEGDPCQTRNP